MQGSSWAMLFRHIPSNLHDSLALLINTGAEIVIQRIIRLEPEFMVVRGRMAGSLDGGRVMILPYSQIINIAFNKRMSEAEACKIFDNVPRQKAVAAIPSRPAPAASAADAAADEHAPQADSAEIDIFGPVDAPAAANDSDTDASDSQDLEDGSTDSSDAADSDSEVDNENEGTNGSKKKDAARASPPSKSVLLARLRARLAGEKK